MTLYDEYSRSIISQAIQSRRAKACMIAVIFFGIITLLVSFLLPIYRGLVCLFWLIIASSTFIPIAPHEPVILLYGKLYVPWLVTLCAGIAVLVMELVNYHILAPILNSERIRAFREKQFYQRAEHCFSKFPFLSLLLACLAPVPFVPLRILAVTTRYSVKKYALSVFIGSTARFYLLALMGNALDLPAWVYIIFLVIAFSIALTEKLAGHKKGIGKRRRRSTDGNCLSPSAYRQDSMEAGS